MLWADVVMEGRVLQTSTTTNAGSRPGFASASPPLPRLVCSTEAGLSWQPLASSTYDLHYEAGDGVKCVIVALQSVYRTPSSTMPY